jgi:Flp pilus assembly protein TadD
VASFVRIARQQLQQSIRPETRLAWIGLVSLVVGHLVDLQFSFETVGSAVVFWLALALAAGSARVERGGDRNPTLDRPQTSARRHASVLAALPLVLVATGLILTLGLRPFMADLAHKESLDSQPDLAERVAAAERAVSLWPLEPRYHQGLAELLVAQHSYERALAQLSTANQLRPHDPRMWAAMGRLYARWAQEDPAQGPVAQAAYERALALAPNVASYHTELGAVLAERGQLELGAARTERAVQLDATDVVAYRQLAAVYEALGRIDDARWADEQAQYWSSRTGGTPE